MMVAWIELSKERAQYFGTLPLKDYVLRGHIFKLGCSSTSEGSMTELEQLHMSCVNEVPSVPRYCHLGLHLMDLSVYQKASEVQNFWRGNLKMRIHNR